MRMLPAALFVAAAVGCAGRGSKPAEPPAPVRTPARDTLLAVDLSRSDSVDRLGFESGMLAWMAEDVAFLRAGIPAVFGRDAVRAVLSSGSSPSAATYRWQPLGGGLSRDGRSGYTYGIAATVSVGAETAGPALRMDRYIAFWRRQQRGDWRIVAYAEVGAASVTGTVPERGLAPPGHPVIGRTAERLAELRRTDAEFSDAASRMGVPASFAAWAAPTGIVVEGAELLVGPDAIRATMANLYAGRSLAWFPVHATLAESGELGFTLGEYVSTGRSSAGAVAQSFGKYLTVWERQPDARWRFVAEGSNRSPAPGATRSAGREGER
jgi:ketosteroid isomerase-like protein